MIAECKPEFEDLLAELIRKSGNELHGLIAAISSEIVAIDRFLQNCIRQILRNPRFQRLEAAATSVYQLVSLTEADPLMPQETTRSTNIFVLDVSADELTTDLSAVIHRRTYLYDKLYRKRFDRLIGEKEIEHEKVSAIYPFSLILYDFEFCYPQVTNSETQIGLDVLSQFARIGEDCFCMFLGSLAPNFFDKNFDSFEFLDRVVDRAALLNDRKFDAWKEFQASEESRMIGLALPRILVRKPHTNVRLKSGSIFNEFDGFPKRHQCLWGNACFAVVQPIIRSFLEHNWFTNVSGVDRNWGEIQSHLNEERNRSPQETSLYCSGVITALPDLSFGTDLPAVANFPPTELVISESDEALFQSFGFISIFSINHSPFVATLSSSTVQRPKKMSTSEATNNYVVATYFNYMLCACRFAHRLKMVCNHYLGQSKSPEEFESEIQEWLLQYVTGSGRGIEQKMARPFLDSETWIRVTSDPINPGRLDCEIRLCPHHKYDNGQTRLIFEPVKMAMNLNSNDK